MSFEYDNRWFNLQGVTYAAGFEWSKSDYSSRCPRWPDRSAVWLDPLVAKVLDRRLVAPAGGLPDDSGGTV